MTRPLVLHLGASRAGTSARQEGSVASLDALALDQASPFAELATLVGHAPGTGEASDQVRRLTDLGGHVRAGLERWVPDASAAEPLSEVTDQEIASAAIETFADFAVQSFSDHRRRQARSAAGGDGARGPADAE